MRKKTALASVSLDNMTAISVDGMVRCLTDSYVRLIANNKPLRLMPPIMLWGAPGLGKSQGVRQLGSSLKKAVRRDAHITDVRLLLFNPVDLRGIPVADVANSTAIWLKPKIFDLDPSDGVINILFLDEISSAPPSVQAAAYQIVLDRAVGEHKLPDNCIIIAAGNRVTDRSVAWQMPRALANRLCHMEIICDPDSWRRWAISTGVHELVCAYMARRPDQLHNPPDADDDTAYPSPRTWEMASNVLLYAAPDIDAAFPLLCGCIGSGAATEFSAFFRIGMDIPPMKDIFSGKCPKRPKKPDALYALVSAMASYASLNRDNFSALNNSISYAMDLPPEFSTLLIHDYLGFEQGFRQKLMEKCPALSQWLQRNGDLL